jgi:predicted site-specific integrase-resolvase
MKEVVLVKAGKLKELTGIAPATLKRRVKAGKIICYKVQGKPRLCYYDFKEIS